MTESTSMSWKRHVVSVGEVINAHEFLVQRAEEPPWEM